MRKQRKQEIHDFNTNWPRKRTWARKFRDAFLGLRQSIHRQSSYRVHFTAAVIVIAAGWLLGMDHVRWSLLVLCITIVLSAEMFNTALETLAKAITSDYNEHLGRALNIASAAVLTAAIGATIVGSLLFIEAIGRIFGGFF